MLGQGKTGRARCREEGDEGVDSILDLFCCEDVFPSGG